MDGRAVTRVFSRLAHGWRLINSAGAPKKTIQEFIRPAVRAVPSSMARRIGPCRISLLALPDPAEASRWTETDLRLEVCVSTSGSEDHDIALELLLCLGQALWGRLSSGELRAYGSLLHREMLEGVTGEIDDQALVEKRSLLASRFPSRGLRRLERYACASFAGTAAEYVHCLWHNVTVRAGPDHLPAPQLQRRLELLARWFPPDRGYRLFPSSRITGKASRPRRRRT